MTQQLDLFSQPKTRTRDRATSRDAATAVAKGSIALEAAIIEAVAADALTDEEIIDRVHQAHGDRWLGSTIISGRKRCVDARRLIGTAERRRNRRGRDMTVWRRP